MEFKFTNEYPDSKIDEIISYLLGPRLWIPSTDYPDFDIWAGNAYKELKKESKRAMLALSRGDIVGVTVYQRHKKDIDALEIKNLTVRPDARGRYVASFLLRNSELEGKREFRSKYALCDAKANNLQVHYFLTKHNYKTVCIEDLYSNDSGSDRVYKKDLSLLQYL